MSLRVRKIVPYLAVLAAIFAFGLVMFGAFVRLSNAGLSCPDWPTCYGKATWPQHAQAVVQANQAFPDRPFEADKAWREQVHRMLAGTLGVLVLLLALVAARRDWLMLLLILLSAIFATAGVTLYLHGAHQVASGLALLAILLPITGALWLREHGALKMSVLALAVIIFQAMLGMWTVTLLLKPVVVMGHLLGGLTTFGLLAYVALRYSGVGAPNNRYASLRRLVVLGMVLLAFQIALGGWTSANYAALACGTDFPTCLGQWAPPTNFHQGFVLWREVGVNYEGGVLDTAARSAIQITHRIGALVVFCYLSWLSYRLMRSGFRWGGIAVLAVLIFQVLLGISNVHLGLPLAVATMHNGGAALLLFVLLANFTRVQPWRTDVTDVLI
ncbi:heme A synthase [Dyella sp. M7H15-1]|uniref:COX15/CtaA family protein n=1 Tax=Dyella sp. M7H15-1 TaxID=2501295 RepID=UPI001004E426|nr:COX15/CtaA family protein [Dyella sp. M7H15-1]QAU24906.1 heme A synthase [Dyella sp. M7H15-1]